MKRNIDRFPNKNCFQLTKEEVNSVIFQFGISPKTNLFKGQDGGSRHLPYVYSEGGVAMLSAVLRSKTATIISLKIIDTFIEMRKYLAENADLLVKVNKLEEGQIKHEYYTNKKFIEYDSKFNEVFNYISDHKESNEKIFYKGQVYEAFSFISDLIGKANKSIILIDNYIDIKTLNILAKKKMNVETTIYTTYKGNKLTTQDIDTFNNEYPLLKVFITNRFHDRFLILDNKAIFLIGASIKDAGNKCFAITEINKSNIENILKELQE